MWSPCPATPSEIHNMGVCWFIVAVYFIFGALQESADVLLAHTAIRTMVGSIEGLRRRYPGLAVSYPESPEIAKAVAELRPESKP